MAKNAKYTVGQKIILALIALFTFGFSLIVIISGLSSYNKYSDFSYDDVVFGQFYFEKVERVESGIGQHKRYYNKVHFKDTTAEFYFSSIVYDEVDKDQLKALENTVVNIYYEKLATKRGYEICEISNGGTIVALSLDDYVKAYKGNQTLAYVLGATFALIGVVLLWYFSKGYYQENADSLGKLKIEYTADTNKICFYVSLLGCALVINDKVVYRTKRDINAQVSRFNRPAIKAVHFKAEVNDLYSNNIPVELMLSKGENVAKLYYDGKLVGKKFIGFRW